MAKIKKHIEIIRTSNPVLRSLSKKSALAICDILSSHYTSVGITVINTADDLKKLLINKPDLVFVGMKFLTIDGLDPDSRIWLPDFLEKHGLAYTGSGSFAYKLEHDKQRAKKTITSSGIDTSAFLHLKHGELPKETDINFNYPVFIKPTSGGGGSGIDQSSYAKDFVAVLSKVKSLGFASNSDVIIEEYMPGREFSVAVLKHNSGIGYFVMPLELIAPLSGRGIRILTAKTKQADTEEFLPVNDMVIKARICTLALDAFLALGAKDFGRIDIRLDKDGVPNFLEANLIPSLTEDYGNFPKACQMNESIAYEEMIMHIVRLGFDNIDRGAKLIRKGAVDELSPLVKYA